MADDRNLQHRRNAGTFLALVALLAVAGGLLALVAFVLPPLLVFGFLALVIGAILHVWLQYLLWGRWLTRKLAEEEALAED